AWAEEHFSLDHMHPEDRARVADSWSDLLARPRDSEIEYRMVNADGQAVWVRDIIHASRDHSGQVILQGFMLDITERKRTREEITKSREQLRALSARLQTAREEERINNAREIHDELGGALTALKMDLSFIDSD